MGNVTMQIVNKAEERILINVSDGMISTLDNSTLTIASPDNALSQNIYYIDDIRYFNYTTTTETSVNEISDNSISIRLEPDCLTIFSTDNSVDRYSIVDMAGTIIKQDDMPSTDGDVTTIDTSRYRPGVYIIYFNNHKCIKFTRK